MKNHFNGSRLWEKVAAGFLGLFAIREAGNIINTIFTWIFIFAAASCFLIWYLTS